MWSSLIQVRRLGTGGNGQTVAFANCHVFKVGIQCRVELQSPSDVCVSIAEWISARKCKLELQTLGLRFWLRGNTTVPSDEKFGLV